MISHQQLVSVNTRMVAAIRRSIAKGVPAREAFERHLKALEAMSPKLAALYLTYLLGASSNA